METSPDTIAAVATPPGRGGIGIVRLSGPDALRIAHHLVRPKRPLEPGRAILADVLDPNPDPADPAAAPPATPVPATPVPATPVPATPVIDQAVVTTFVAPHSYTGDDVVEIAAHGAPIVLESLLRSAIAAGARLAQPGEFTQRAFLNCRIDLTQAEAVHDLISAHTLEQARMAAQQLGGALSRRVAPIKEELVTLIALLEAGMDFAPGELDDVDVVPPARIAATIARVREPLEALARSYTQGHRLREGASLALVGRPNVGKSSLFNRLLDRDRAIVTPLPGTTRDTVEETTAIGGIPVRLIDTAGLRLAVESPADQAEALGIARSREALADADLAIVVLDASAPSTAEEQALLESLAARPHLIARNKSDLLPTHPVSQPHPGSNPVISTEAKRSGETPVFRDAETNLNTHPGIPVIDPASTLADAQRNGPQSHPDSLLTSALTGEGLDALRDRILHLLNASGSLATGGVLNSLRQQQAVQESLDGLAAASTANTNAVPHEFLLTDLHAALRALDRLTGQTTTDDILNRIFSTFCIGK